MKKDTKDQLRHIHSELQKALPDTKKELSKTLSFLITKAWEEGQSDKATLNTPLPRGSGRN